MTGDAAPRSRARVWTGYALTTVLVVVAAGLALRATVRDGITVLAPIFYGTPPVLLAAGALAGGTGALVLRRRAAAVAATVLLAAAVAFTSAQWLPAEPPPPPPVTAPLRGLFWNVEHGNGGWPEIIETVRAADPDVLWIGEGPGAEGPDFAAWRRAFRGRAHIAAGSHLHVFVRGAAELVQTRRLGVSGSRGALVRIETRGRTFETLLVDLPSRPLEDRTALLGTIREWAGTRAAPLVIAGDFNTPPDAVGFDSWRGPFRHAFEAAGSGWRPTWPEPAPVLELDHVWGSAGVAFLRTEHPSSELSDHRAVSFDFDVSGAGASAQPGGTVPRTR